METFLPTATQPVDLPRFWEGKTRRVQRFVNAAWFLEFARPVLFLASVLATAIILQARRQSWPAGALSLVGGGLLLLAAGYSFWRARPRFISHAAARAEIESTLQLHSRLSSAAAGIGAWPGVERWQPALWRWHWRRLVALPLCSAGLVLAACLLPLLSLVEPALPPVVKPPALERVEDMLETLARAPQIDQESVQALREEAQQLAAQNPAEWYSHASLEAADHLHAKTQAGAKTLGDGAARLQRLLGREASEAGAEWNEQLHDALNGLQGNVPGLNSQLAKALSSLDPSKLRSLSPEQIAKLRQELAHARAAAREANGERGEGEDGDVRKGHGEDGEPTEDGEGEGNGGVNEGPGTKPLKLGSQPANLDSKQTEALENDDFRRAAMGDALGTSAGQHDVDQKADPRQAEGGQATAGEGASAVWRQQNVTPEERKRLQEFFK